MFGIVVLRWRGIYVVLWVGVHAAGSDLWLWGIIRVMVGVIVILVRIVVLLVGHSCANRRSDRFSER